MVRKVESVRARMGEGYLRGSHEKPRHRGDWLKLEAKWMGGEGDCRDVT